MKKIMSYLLLAALLLCPLLFASSCAGGIQGNQNAAGNRIYYIKEDKNGRRTLEYEYRDDITGETAIDRCMQIIEAVQNPKSFASQPAVPRVMEVHDLRQRGSTLEINYTETYSYLGAAEKVLAAAAVAMSIFEDGEIDYILIRSNGEVQAPMYDGYLFREKIVQAELMRLE